MKMITCNSGHYYDNTAHTSCPYCSGGSVDNITRKTKVIGEEAMGTKATEIAGNVSGQTSIYETVTPNNNVKPTSGEQTVYMPMGTTENKTKEEEKSNALLSGWLVIVSEDGKGQSYPLTFGMNTIGRDSGNHVYIKNADKSISRDKHAIIIYDYQNNLFFVKHGDGQYLSYLNDSVLLENKELKANDRLKVGNTELIFIPLCSEQFTWEK